MNQKNVPNVVGDWLGQQLFEHVPSNIVVINREYDVVLANDHFKDVFGDIRGKRCYEVFKKKSEICKNCLAAKTFEDGEAHVSNEYAVDRNGLPAYYVVHNAPIYNDEGEIAYVIEMSYDVTDTQSLQRQYNVLFERVPCYVAVLDRDLKVVRANELLRKTFGEARGQHCFRVYKQRHDRCEDCPAMRTFADGGSYTREQIGINKKGMLTHYIVSTAPLSKNGSNVNHVMEMSIDVTETHRLSQDLLKESYFRHQLTENAMDALVAVDAAGTVNIFNPAAERLFKVPADEMIGSDRAWDFLPAEFKQTFEQGGNELVLPETIVRDSDDEPVPVRFCGTVLGEGTDVIGGAAFLQDLRALKTLEREKLTNERLAVVGQTVAQLSHGMKNILTGVQGGLYGIKAGIEKNDFKRLNVGRERLERNVNRITELVRGFLNYTKEHTPRVQPTDLNKIAEEVFVLFRDAAVAHGIQLQFRGAPELESCNVDPDDMHTCLTNLVSNAIDACREKDPGEGEPLVEIIVEETDDAVVLVVRDTGCGMDEPTKNKVFHTFFTTKGLQGTGLGLLVTTKLVRAHGGRLEVDSAPGVGSTFRVEIPKSGLPADTNT
jgi:PAS domain S-box-containing protein